MQTVNKMEQVLSSRLLSASSKVDPESTDVLKLIKNQFGQGVYTSVRREADIQPAPVAATAFGQGVPFLGRAGAQNYIWNIPDGTAIFENPILSTSVFTDGASELIGDTMDKRQFPFSELTWFADNVEIARFQQDDMLIGYGYSDDVNKHAMNISGVYTTFTATAAATAVQLGHPGLELPGPFYIGYSEDKQSSRNLIILKGVSQLKLSITWNANWADMSNAATSFVATHAMPSIAQRIYDPSTLAQLVKPFAGQHQLAYYYGIPRTEVAFTSTAGGTFGNLDFNLSSVSDEVVLGLFTYIVPTATVEDPFTAVAFTTDNGTDSIRLQFNSNRVWGRDRVDLLRTTQRLICQRDAPTLEAPPLSIATSTPVPLSGAASANERAIVPIVFGNGSVVELQDVSGRYFPTSSNAHLRFINVQGLAAATAYTGICIPITKRSYEFN